MAQLVQALFELIQCDLTFLSRQTGVVDATRRRRIVVFLLQVLLEVSLKYRQEAERPLHGHEDMREEEAFSTELLRDPSPFGLLDGLEGSWEHLEIRERGQQLGQAANEPSDGNKVDGLMDVARSERSALMEHNAVAHHHLASVLIDDVDLHSLGSQIVDRRQTALGQDQHANEVAQLRLCLRVGSESGDAIRHLLRDLGGRLACECLEHGAHDSVQLRPSDEVPAHRAFVAEIGEPRRQLLDVQVEEVVAALDVPRTRGEPSELVHAVLFDVRLAVAESNPGVAAVMREQGQEVLGMRRQVAEIHGMKHRAVRDPMLMLLRCGFVGQALLAVAVAQTMRPRSPEQTRHVCTHQACSVWLLRANGRHVKGIELHSNSIEVAHTLICLSLDLCEPPRVVHALHVRRFLLLRFEFDVLVGRSTLRMVPLLHVLEVHASCVALGGQRPEFVFLQLLHERRLSLLLLLRPADPLSVVLLIFHLWSDQGELVVDGSERYVSQIAVGAAHEG